MIWFASCQQQNVLLPYFLIKFIKEKASIQVFFQAVHKNILNLNIKMLGNMIANWNIKKLIIF